MERVIEAAATVVAVEDGVAWVEAERRSACSHCSSADGCGTGSLAKVFGPGRTRFRISNTIGLQTGQRVQLGIDGGTLLRASFTAYLLPLVVLIAAAGAATAVDLAEGLVALIGIGGLGAGLWLSARITVGRAVADRYRPTLVEAPSGPPQAPSVQLPARHAD